MIYNLFNVKCILENHLVSDVIKLIQYDLYLLNIKNDVMRILDDHFSYDEEAGKIYITEYKKMRSEYYGKDDYVKFGYQWNMTHNDKQYITLTYKKIKIKNTYRYGLMIRMSTPTTSEDLPAFKRIESRMMENTIHKKVKSGYNRIYLI
jgi:hypothetical protein